MKYIVVNGGVISGLGKGITASSIGLLFKEAGYSVTAVKIDPYLNVDAGTMSPYEHGEVYVLDDGTETDLDLGNYERFLDVKLQKEHSITSGKVFQRVIDEERQGKYIGQTVQFIPHVTDTVTKMLHEAAHVPLVEEENTPPDLCIIELGGTVGDMESMHFVEALRQMRCQYPSDFCFVAVSLLLNVNGEEKTKPTQQCLQEMRRLGLAPDVLVLRAETMISDDAKRKIGLHCHVSPENIVANTNTAHIYEVPELLNRQGIVQQIGAVIGLLPQRTINVQWRLPYGHTRMIAVVGKYTKNHDTYLSIHRALEHATFAAGRAIGIHYLSCEEPDLCLKLDRYDGIVLPGGFGGRGMEGMIACAQSCRDKDIPLLGICLGMQMMCVAAVRLELGTQCVSSEHDTQQPQYQYQSQQQQQQQQYTVVPMESLDQTKMGGTMKLGRHTTRIQHDNTKTFHSYKTNKVTERHRHRYEINPHHVASLKAAGITVTGLSSEGCVDIVEDTERRFYIGCQFHPEYQSHLHRPSPLFVGFVNAM